MGQRQSVSTNPREIYEFLNLIDPERHACVTEPLYITKRNIDAINRSRLEKTLNLATNSPDIRARHQIPIIEDFIANEIGLSNTLPLLIEHRPEPAFYSSLDDCLAQEYPFIVMPVFLSELKIEIQGISSLTGTFVYGAQGVNPAHLNVVLIDNRTKEIERFEPYGDVMKDFVSPGVNVDAYIRGYLAQFPSLKDYTYHPPSEYCPVGPQTLQSIDPRSWMFYKGGFCGFWSVYYVATRLRNPDFTGKEISKFLTHLGFWTLYTDIVEFRDTLLRNEYPKVFIILDKPHWKKVLNS